MPRTEPGRSNTKETIVLKTSHVRLLIIPAALALGSVAGASRPAESASAFPYPSGRIIYQFNAGQVSGTSVLQWIESGKRFRQDMKGTGTAPQAFTSVESWTIGDGTYMYVHQPNMGKQVMRMKIPKAAGAGMGSPIAAGKGMGKLVGKGTIIGKPCEIREAGPAKVWIWKGLALKMESRSSPQAPPVTMLATKLEAPLKLPASLFK